MKEFDVTFDLIISREVNVPDQYTLTAYTSRSAGNQAVDPRLVAFYPEIDHFLNC